ncbi:MAG: hypothetical protein IT260_00615 [Saprospiraceae bacterium]|nr:hypothetical protein [Saprospiraceae bacterium]
MLTFNGLLPQFTLEQLQQCFLQAAANRFQLQYTTVGLGVDPVLIECRGKLRVSFERSDGSAIHLDLTSLFGEVDIPLVEQGKLHIDVHTEHWKPLAEQLAEPQVAEFYCTLAYPDMAPIAAIQCYGNQLDEVLNTIDPDIDLSFLQEQYGLNEFPRVLCQSIEFVVFCHKNGRKTILVLQSGGFRVLFYETVPDLPALLHRYNPYGKNTVLHQEVS